MRARVTFQPEACGLKISQQSGRGSINTVHLPISYQAALVDVQFFTVGSVSGLSTAEYSRFSEAGMQICYLNNGSLSTQET